MKKLNMERYEKVENILEYWSLNDIKELEDMNEDDVYECIWELAETFIPIYTKDIYEAAYMNWLDMDDIFEEIGFNTERTLTDNLMSGLFYVYQNKIRDEYDNFVEALFDEIDVEEED